MSKCDVDTWNLQVTHTEDGPFGDGGDILKWKKFFFE